MYQAKRISHSEFVPIRHQNYHVRVWGKPVPGVAPLVLVHGWMDVAASYQFLVDALSDSFVSQRHIIAPDWRGYGLSTGSPVDNYWNPDYVADLDFLIDHYSPDQSVDLVGHSMGGSVVMQYGAVRPARIRRLINLEGFGGPVRRATSAPKHMAAWLDDLKAMSRGDIKLKTYATVTEVAKRLMKTNPRLARDQAGHDRAEWLACHWAAETKDGQWEILGDPAHKISGPLLTRLEELLAMYAAITAPTLVVVASDDSLTGWFGGKFTQAEFDERLKSVPNLQRGRIEDAGHMLHHDQPEQLARMIEDFVV